MLFHTFSSQEERRAFGGSAFLEIQFCKLPSGTRTRKIVAINSIKNWQDDSLYIYVDDIDIFIERYSHIFDCGIYNNLKSGIVDECGINYYSPSLIDSIVEKLCTDKPMEYEALVEWLNKGKYYNGFYILGI